MSTELDLGWFDPNLGALQRREASGLSTGLSRAIAERLGVDVILVRVVFVVLTFCAGLGLALYGWGTVLTRGPQGVRPVDQFLPGFRGWSPFSQKTLVVVSTIAFIATIGSAFPLPWGAGVLVLIALVLLRRRRPVTPQWAPPGSPMPYAPATSPAPRGPVDDHTLVDQWRQHLADAVGTHRAAVPAPHRLPEVDLYAPDEPLRPPPAPQAKAGWWGGLAVVAAMALAGVVARLALGLPGPMSLAAVTAVGGFGAILFALVSRHRRIPRPVLAAVALCVVGTGWLATQLAAVSPFESASTYHVRVVADEAVVDLTTVDLSQYEVVQVEAFMSEVTVLLPGKVESLTSSSTWGGIYDLTGPMASDEKVLPIELRINARLADVRIEERP